MKAFLRHWKNDEYVWKDTEYRNETFFVDNSPTDYTRIIALEGDNRTNIVSCSNCGNEFLRDSKEWYDHVTKKKHDTNKCFSCENLMESQRASISKAFTELPSGVYEIDHKYTTECLCTRSWPYFKIQTAIQSSNCKCHQCMNATPNTISDFFTQYPGAFDCIPTVKQVIKHGFKEVKERRGETAYYLKGKNRVAAIVNSLQIIDHFIFEYRSYSNTIYYSKRYNKFFMSIRKGRTNSYGEWTRPYYMPEETFEYIKKKIASIYD